VGATTAARPRPSTPPSHPLGKAGAGKGGERLTDMDSSNHGRAAVPDLSEHGLMAVL